MFNVTDGHELFTSAALILVSVNRNFVDDWSELNSRHVSACRKCLLTHVCSLHRSFKGRKLGSKGKQDTR